VATYYEILGVARDATVAEIRTAHRVRVQLVHPDRHHGAPDAVLEEAARQTRDLNEALEVLTDVHRRADYDAGLRPEPEPLIETPPKRRRDVDCPACGFRETVLFEQRYVTCHACRTRYGFVTCRRCGNVQPALLTEPVVRCRACDTPMRTQSHLR